MKYIKTFENYNDNALKVIAEELSQKLHCDRFGACVHFAEEFVLKVHQINPELLNQFFVIEGFVNWSHGDGIPQQHTWIELTNGEKIDPTYIQFTKYGTASYSRKIKNKFTGLEYYNDTIGGTWFSDRRKKFPEMIYK
jgi:hypothetical protein